MEHLVTKATITGGRSNDNVTRCKLCDIDAKKNDELIRLLHNALTAWGCISDRRALVLTNRADAAYKEWQASKVKRGEMEKAT